MLVAVVVIFFLCWTPRILYTFLDGYHQWKMDSLVNTVRQHETIDSWLYMISYLNSCANAVVYFFTSEWVQCLIFLFVGNNWTKQWFSGFGSSLGHCRITWLLSETKLPFEHFEAMLLGCPSLFLLGLQRRHCSNVFHCSAQKKRCTTHGVSSVEKQMDKHWPRGHFWKPEWLVRHVLSERFDLEYIRTFTVENKWENLGFYTMFFQPISIRIHPDFDLWKEKWKIWLSIWCFICGLYSLHQHQYLKEHKIQTHKILILAKCYFLNLFSSVLKCANYLWWTGHSDTQDIGILFSLSSENFCI